MKAIEVQRNKIAKRDLVAVFNDPMSVLVNLFGERKAFALVGSDVALDSTGTAPAGMGSVSDLLVDPMNPGSGTTVDGISLNGIWNDMIARLAAFNATRDRFVSLLTFPVTKANEIVGVPTSPGFQKATEFGRPRKSWVTNIARGFPLDHYDIGTGYSQEFIDSARADQILALQAQIFSDWNKLGFALVLDALFGSANYTDDTGIAVKRLYNNDGEVPPAFERNTHDGTHTHYLTSASLDIAAIRAMKNHLKHHGFDGEIYMHVNGTDVVTVRGLTGFVPAQSSTTTTIVDGTIVGATPSNPGGGFTVEGYIEGMGVVENGEIPAGYLMAVVVGGFDNPRNPVGIRLHDNPSIGSGLRLIEGPRQVYPLYDSVFDGYVGAGVGQRGSAVITQITGGAYTDPTFG